MTAVGFDAQRVTVLDIFDPARAVLGELADRGITEVASVDGAAALTVSDVATLAGISETRAQDILKSLTEAGELARGKNGRAFVYWKAPIAEGAEAHRSPGVTAPSVDSSVSSPDDEAPQASVGGETGANGSPTGSAPVMSTADPAGNLPEEVAASLDLLRDVGGKAYCGTHDDRDRKTIALPSATMLESLGLVRVEDRNAYRVAVLIEVGA